MHNISQVSAYIRKYFFPVILFSFLLVSCNEEELSVQPYSLTAPSSSPMISRDLLVSGTSYSPGYLNGNIRSDQVTLSWNTSADAEFLCVKLFKNGNELMTYKQAGAGTYTDTLVSDDEYYKYSVAVINKNGMHKLDTITIKTPRFQPPVLHYQVLTGTSLKIFWEKTAESATSYILEKSTTTSPPYNFETLAMPADTFYIDDNVVNGNLYVYRISALNQYEQTAFSSPSFITIAYTMNAPELQPLYQLAGRRVELNWYDNSTGESGFRIYRRGDSPEFEMIGDVNSTRTEFIDADTTVLQPGENFSYYVQGYNETDTTPRSNIRNITIVPYSSGISEGFESGFIQSPWFTSGNSEWVISSNYPYAGNYCAKSGVVSHSEVSYIQTNLSFSGTKTISFYYRVSSEQYSDYLIFSINGGIQSQWSGETGWSYYSTSYTGSGTITLTWEYRKDGFVSSGSDAAWIDNIVVQ